MRIFLQPMESKGLLPWPIRSKIIWTKYTPIKRIIIRNNYNKYKYLFSEREASKNVKTWRNPSLGLDLSMHVNKNPILSWSTPFRGKCRV